jgi:hypothetical protein
MESRVTKAYFIVDNNSVGSTTADIENYTQNKTQNH